MGRSKKRQLVLLKFEASDEPVPATVPLGSRTDFLDRLARLNTAPDGAPRGAVGTEVLHGPGIVVEFTSGQDEIRQALINVIDEETAWPVLSRICRDNGWKMQDTESGQTFG